MGYVIAKYIRLSMEDTLSDSMSIENQRLMLDLFIAKIGDADVEAREFVDNGYTGTNFERPAFQNLIKQARTGQVDCIVVKDFSRFGRDMLDVGHYLERVFPLFRVRFISLGDEYDSAQNPDGVGGGEDVPFRLLVNEFYSKDLSNKIRMAAAIRTQMGVRVTKNTIYGYKLNDKREMVIDPETADTVRLIFRMALQGQRVSEIQRRLYEEKRPAPGAHKGHRTRKKPDAEFQCVWSGSVIQSILHDEQYTGTYVGGKTAALEVGGNKVRRKDEGEWVKIPNHHPAIVGREDFDALQAKRAVWKKGSRQKCKPVGQPSPLKGKVFCGHCGHALNPGAASTPVWRCVFTRKAPDIPCHRMAIGKLELDKTVLAQVLGRLRAIAATSTDGNNPHSRAPAQGISAYREGMRLLYERFRAGELDEVGYKAGLMEMNREKHSLIMVPTGVVALPGMKTPSTASLTDLRELARKTLAAPSLTQEMADALIEKVLVHPGGHVQICWRPEVPINKEDMEYAG